MKLNLEVEQTRSGKWIARLVGKNGEVVLSTRNQRYERKAGAVRALQLAHATFFCMTWKTVREFIRYIPPTNRKKRPCKKSK